jgi:hypothetical protein
MVMISLDPVIAQDCAEMVAQHDAMRLHHALVLLPLAGRKLRLLGRRRNGG